MKMIIHKRIKMKIIKTLLLFSCLIALSCAFVSKSSDEQKTEKLNIYAKNKKGGYLNIQTDKDGNAYFKIKGANYSNHYFGKVLNENGVISFIADKAIRINNCKSSKYGNSVIGIELGNDKKVYNFLQKIDVSYKLNTGEYNNIPIKKASSYISIPNQDKVSVVFKSNKNFFKNEEITFNPNTTMLCLSSRIRLSEYKFKIDNNKIIALNYFGNSQVYEINKK